MRRVSSLEPWACSASFSRSARSGVVHGGPKVGDLLLDGERLVLLAGLEFVGDALHLGRDDGPQAGDGLLAALLAGGHDDLAGRGEDDGLLGGRGLDRRQLGFDRLGGRRDLLGPGGPLALQVRLGRGKLDVELVLLAIDVRAELVLELAEGLARLAATAGGLLVEIGQEPSPDVLVDARDDVEREVEDPLQVPGADVEQDPEPGRRALEVPDVADRAGQLDVAHPLAADLRARDLDAALVADDALVSNPLVLAAVALPVLGGTEDAFVEETILLGLERPVVDRLRLRHLTLGPLPDLVRAGKRDANGVEIVDLEHRSPPRRRLASAARSGPGASVSGPAGTRGRV